MKDPLHWESEVETLFYHVSPPSSQQNKNPA